jgi:hypothetical protein
MGVSAIRARSLPMGFFASMARSWRVGFSSDLARSSSMGFSAFMARSSFLGYSLLGALITVASAGVLRNPAAFMNKFLSRAQLVSNLPWQRFNLDPARIPGHVALRVAVDQKCSAIDAYSDIARIWEFDLVQAGNFGASVRYVSATRISVCWQIARFSHLPLLSFGRMPKGYHALALRALQGRTLSLGFSASMARSFSLGFSTSLASLTFFLFQRFRSGSMLFWRGQLWFPQVDLEYTCGGQANITKHHA